MRLNQILILFQFLKPIWKYCNSILGRCAHDAWSNEFHKGQIPLLDLKLCLNYSSLGNYFVWFSCHLQFLNVCYLFHWFLSIYLLLQMFPILSSGAPVSEYPFVRTGLLGFVGPGGMVFVVGKMDGLMVVSGRRHNADDIVATALAVEPMKFVYRGRSVSVPGLHNVSGVDPSSCSPLRPNNEWWHKLCISYWKHFDFVGIWWWTKYEKLVLDLTVACHKFNYRFGEKEIGWEKSNVYKFNKVSVNLF